MTTSLANAVRRLDEEPLFHASMASRELFHTNLIWWLSRKHANAARVLIARLGLPLSTAPIVVDREVRLQNRILPNGKSKRQVIDLHVQSECGSAGIELKIGAIPSTDQLVGYPEAIAARSGPGKQILLSLHKPTALPSDWSWLSLSELSEAFQDAHYEVGDQFARDLVLREVTLLRRLVVLATAVNPATRTGEPWFTDSGTIKLIGDARAGTIVEKARVSGLLAHLGPVISEYGLKSETGFSNGTGNVTCWCEGEQTIFGWQLQGNQYRLYGSHDVGISAQELRKRIHPYWFDFTGATRFLPRLLTPRGTGAGKFGPFWAYEYRQLPADVSTGDVVRLLTAETERLKELAPSVK